jgi:lipopolysaccharide transport system ATP-binding protein
MQTFMQSGRTVLFVSHSMGSISERCTSAILLNRGTIVRTGPVAQVIEAYLGLLNLDRGLHDVAQLTDRDCTISSVQVLTADGKPSRVFDLEDPVIFEFRYRLHRRLQGFQISLSLARNLVEIVRTFDTDGCEALPVREAGEYVCRHTLPPRFLKAGSYLVSISVGTPERQMLSVEHAVSFEVEELTENTRQRGYHAIRPGHVISPGKWTTELVGDSVEQASWRSGIA